MVARLLPVARAGKSEDSIFPGVIYFKAMRVSMAAVHLIPTMRQGLPVIGAAGAQAGLRRSVNRPAVWVWPDFDEKGRPLFGAALQWPAWPAMSRNRS